MKAEFEERLKNFLGGYWHQDVASTESGLQEVFMEHSTEQIRELIEIIKEFLGGPDDPSYKRSFIDYWADGVVFEDPIEWLRGILKKMSEYIHLE
ncbi:contact-dependent growth inhibition system immunity protein [Alicyclobacillus vulcanalis]|uniref:CdiI immunity protein domain-containing protein n=1 Tax=Alicyclobacillus vulcanalis TaxID=252246 RepID=A0A1N7PWP4_9BACL|nr:contact-dependent growth inhibition system immunity protein [Alicyclobacillus vulcanalis]SIT15006.1 hypothetical protein SAMN05421799_1232 [Alicyclobacillus vulcanalis]